MGNRVIFLDVEAEEILINKKTENPSFNFSQFVQDALKNIKQRQKLNYEEVKDKLRKHQTKLTEIKGEIDFLDDEKIKFELIEQAEKRLKLEKKAKEEQKQIDKIESRINNFMYFYKNIDLRTATELADEFDPIQKQRTMTMYEFLDGKGYVKKTTDELNALDEKKK